MGNMNAWGYYAYPTDYPGLITSPGGKRLPGWAPNGAMTATWSFYDSFSPTDARRALLIPSYIPVNSAGNAIGGTKDRTNMRGPIIDKYPDDDPTAFAGNDIPVCRFADVLLMLAEAINEKSGPTLEAQGFINKVRNRAGLSNLTGTDISDKDLFRDAILRERGWELFFEGVRRVDLIRMGKFTQIVTAAGKSPQPGTGLFPVPQYMLEQGMQPTPGY
jgi:starch-binding outer membrane protein, SusD/RagB family